MTTLDVVVLAGGASRRMGRDKAVLPVGGQRLVDRVAERWAGTAGRVMVASGRRPLGRDDELADARGCTGPLAGILAAVRVSEADQLAIVPVDAPDTDPRLLERLGALCDRGGRTAAVAVVDGHVQALHAVLSRHAAPAVEVRVAAGERSPRGLLAWLDALVIDVDGWGHIDPAGRFAWDWDRPEDLPPHVRPD